MGDGIIIDIPNVAKNQLITIKDVIIEPGKNILFTYQNDFYQGKQKINSDYRGEINKRMAELSQRPEVPLLPLSFT